MRLVHLVAAAGAALLLVAAAGAAAGPRATIWFLHGETLRATDREVAGEGLKGHVAVLLSGPTAVQRAQGLGTAIPTGTRVRSVWVARGTATIDLTRRFAGGGGSLSMQARLAQLVWTATALPGIERVVLKLDGKRIDALGGEGLLVDRPQTRALHTALLPRLVVEAPAQGATVRGPRVTVRGSARTRTGAFTLVLTDGDGEIVAQRRLASRKGVRVPFRVTLPFVPRKPGWGAVIAYEGPRASRQSLVELPVRVASRR
jgi:hypothetical protein